MRIEPDRSVLDTPGARQSFESIYDSPKSAKTGKRLTSTSQGRQETEQDCQMAAMQQMGNIEEASCGQEIRSTVDLRFELENGLVRVCG